MTTMISEIYDAFKEAKVSDAVARKAAEAIAAHESRFASLEAKLQLLTWMVGFNLILTVALVGKEFLGK